MNRARPAIHELDQKLASLMNVAQMLPQRKQNGGEESHARPVHQNDDTSQSARSKLARKSFNTLSRLNRSDSVGLRNPLEFLEGLRVEALLLRDQIQESPLAEINKFRREKRAMREAAQEAARNDGVWVTSR